MAQTCEKEIMKLDKLVERSKNEETKILIDTSIFSPKRNFSVRLYEQKRYRDINIEEITETMERIECSARVLQTPRTLVLSEVIQEIENLEKIIYRKKSTMDRIENKKIAFKKNRMRAELSESTNTRKILLDDLCLQTMNLKKKLKTRLFESEKRDLYEETYKLLISFDDKMRLKRETDYKDFFNPICDLLKPRYNTDEKIVAAGLLLSLNKNSPIDILSADGHLQTLLRIYFKLIENKDFEKYHERINKKLEKAPIQIFYYDGCSKDYICETSISSVKGSQRNMQLFIRGTNKTLSKEETDEIRGKITSNLENLLR